MASQADTENEIVIEGILDRVTYANEESTFSVVRIFLPEDGSRIAAVGNLLGARPGENLRLRGRWESHARHGRQFRVASFLPLEPSTRAGIQKYLGSGIIPGIGKEMARRIVDHFGTDTLGIIEREGHRLVEVEGIGRIRSAQLLEAWRSARQLQEIMVFLQAHGISSANALRIQKRYGAQALARVRENPYQLASEIPGIGFLTADRIARDLGLRRDAPERLDAGILHALESAADDGHLFLTESRLFEEAEKLLEVERADIARRLEVLLGIAAARSVPLPGGETAVYPRALFEAEEEVALRLKTLLGRQGTVIPVDLPRALTWIRAQTGLDLVEEQRLAVEMALREKALIVTGGPGTGKTTLLNALLRILEKKSVRMLLAAPTGRAARRMAEATGREARTIHRLLEFNPRLREFQRNARAPLEADLIVIDEMSMVDLPLFLHLLRAVPPAARLLLVGDIDQLPAVGPGNVLRDLESSGAMPVVRLRHIFRQGEASRIVLNAHRVNAGEFPLESADGDVGDFFFLPEEDPERIAALLLKIVAKRIPERFGFDPLADVQVLTPMQRGPLGAVQLNAELQRTLNPTGEGLLFGARIFRAGDRVIQLRNNYDLDIFNGDTGTIRSVQILNQQLAVDFAGRAVEIAGADLGDLALAYAITIHKSQGSEFPAVVIPLHTSHYMLLQRNLLYTALTRGKKLVVLVGSRRAVGRAVHHNPMVARNTRLRAMLASPE